MCPGKQVHEMERSGKVRVEKKNTELVYINSCYSVTALFCHCKVQYAFNTDEVYARNEAIVFT